MSESLMWKSKSGKKSQVSSSMQKCKLCLVQVLTKYPICEVSGNWFIRYPVHCHMWCNIAEDAEDVGNVLHAQLFQWTYYSIITWLDCLIFHPMSSCYDQSHDLCHAYRKIRKSSQVSLRIKLTNSAHLVTSFGCWLISKL